MRGIHRGPVNSPHKGAITRKMFPFNDVIMLDFCSFLAGGYLFPQDPDFRWLCVCSAKMARTACGVSEITEYMLFRYRHRYLRGRDWGCSLQSYHFQLKMLGAGRFHRVKYFLGKLKNCTVYHRNIHCITFSVNIKIIFIMEGHWFAYI